LVFLNQSSNRNSLLSVTEFSFLSFNRFPTYQWCYRIRWRSWKYGSRYCL